MLKLIIFNNYKILRAIINYRIEKKKETQRSSVEKTFDLLLV